MAIDPIFISLDDIPEFAAIGGVDTLNPEQQAQLAAVRAARSVQHSAVRALKNEVLQTIFEQFFDEQWQPGSPRAEACGTYIERERWWLDDYALFRALHAAHEQRSWMEWAAPLRDREPGALDDARERTAARDPLLPWLQWLADEQWAAARAAAGLAIFGDFPFMVSSATAPTSGRASTSSVSTRRSAFRPTRSPRQGRTGACRPTGGTCSRRTVTSGCASAPAAAPTLFDGFRVDHLVGFYRTFVREQDGSTAFHPPDEPAQVAQGRAAAHAVPGTRRLHHRRGSRDRPGLRPRVARSSRHPGPEGHALGTGLEGGRQAVPGSRRVSRRVGRDQRHARHRDDGGMVGETDRRGTRGGAGVAGASQARESRPDEPFSERVPRRAAEVASSRRGSDLLLVPVQDVFGWRDRINIPAVVERRATGRGGCRGRWTACGA